METTTTHSIERPLEQLHLHLPLISTRRPSGPAIGNESNRFYSIQSTDTSRMVPFLWERSPGVPKDAIGEFNSTEYGDYFLPPKPPPRQWRPPREYDYNLDSNDNGNDGDVENCCSGSNTDEVFSDAFDQLSLSESLGGACRLSGLDGLASKDIETSVNRAPSFIMNRFLPAANALAAASVPGFAQYSNQQRAPSCSHHVQRGLIANMHPRHQTTTTTNAKKAQSDCIPRGNQARSSRHSKARGLMLVFPWSLKRTLCGGFNSPVRCHTPRSNLEAFTQRSKNFWRDGLGSEVGDDGVSCKASKSPGWGLPFLDTNRLKTKRRSVEKGKGMSFMVARESELGGGRSPRKPMWSLPRLKSPSEPWLSHAVNSINRRY